MKRDMDLIRKILLALEDWSEYSLPARTINYQLEKDGYSQEVVSYHVWLLADAELVVTTPEQEDDWWFPVYLTWSGHEFLEAIKDDNRWNKVKKAMNGAGGFVYEVGKQVALELLKNQALTYLP